MPRSRGVVLSALIVVVIAAVPSVVSAQSGSGASPAVQEGVRAYVLDEANSAAIIATLKELTAAVVARPNWQAEIAASMKLSPAERAAKYDNDPTYKAILQKHDLTSHSYTTGLYALRAASTQAQGTSMGPLTGLASEANVAFLKAHPEIVQQFQQAETGGLSGRK